MNHLESLDRFYENEGLEELRLKKDGSHYLEYLTASKYISRFLPERANVLDSCAGSGVYAFSLAADGHIVTAGDIVAFNVELIRKKQAENPVLKDIYQGDARDLSAYEDESFDAVLCMGALYHFSDPCDRARIVAESLRVLRTGGIFVCTYMNRYAVILGNSKGSLDNIDEILTFAEDGRENIFYASTPSEMEALLDNAGLETLCHVALDGISNYLHETTAILNKKGFERWRRFHFATCEEHSLLGYSYHNMMIGRK